MWIKKFLYFCNLKQVIVFNNVLVLIADIKNSVFNLINKGYIINTLLPCILEMNSPPCLAGVCHCIHMIVPLLLN